MWIQKHITLPAYTKGFHILNDIIHNELPEIAQYNKGMLHLQLMHTSASLSINESADPDVRKDMEEYFHRLIPENQSFFRHTSEGPDDMPAHIKSSILGCSLHVPISQGALVLGTWQAIYLGEHRNHGGQRTLFASLFGE